MRKIFTASLVLLISLALAPAGFTQAEPVVYADFDLDASGVRTNEHAVDMIWSEEDAAGGVGSISFLIDPDQPDDDSPEGKIEIDLPDGINIADYTYASFYYKCDTEAYNGSNIFMMPMLEGGAGGGGSHHGGSMFGDGEWHYQ
ncbi:hypothetical protein K8I31_02795, partial [bacterium]|nr:hypothetical protein [bacterium]